MLKVAISMICEKKIQGNYYYLIQKRTNMGIIEWKGKWEFPQGVLGDNDFLGFARFKFNNETGMHLDELHISKGKWINSDSHIQIDSCEPFIVVMAHGDLALHFFVRGTGTPIDTEQAINHQWVPAETLEELLRLEMVCPLNIGAFESLIRMDRTGNIDNYLL